MTYSLVYLSSSVVNVLLLLPCCILCGLPLPASCFLLAGGADEAAGVVGLAQGRHHLPFDEVLAAEAAGPVQPLVVQSADVVPLTHEEASLGQLASTYCDKKRNREGKRGRATEGAGKQGQRGKITKG